MGKKHGFSFSWKRATGIAAAKGKISRNIGIPLTRAGRQRKMGKMAGCCLPFLFAVLLSLSVVAVPITAKIVGVSDGDTVTALDANNVQAKIRLNGVDCPESKQAFGSKAKDFTSAACFGKIVKIEILDQDRYGRQVATITLPDGKILNQELVRAGFAWWYQQYAPNDVTLKKLEADAKAARVGLWADANPIAPWEFRNGESSNQTPNTALQPQDQRPRITAQSPENQSQQGQVYVAPTGKKYHKQNCRTLKNGGSPVALQEAKARGYEACKVCGG